MRPESRNRHSSWWCWEYQPFCPCLRYFRRNWEKKKKEKIKNHGHTGAIQTFSFTWSVYRTRSVGESQRHWYSFCLCIATSKSWLASLIAVCLFGRETASCAPALGCDPDRQIWICSIFVSLRILKYCEFFRKFKLNLFKCNLFKFNFILLFDLVVFSLIKSLWNSKRSGVET